MLSSKELENTEIDPAALLATAEMEAKEEGQEDNCSGSEQQDTVVGVLSSMLQVDIKLEFPVTLRHSSASPKLTVNSWSCLCSMIN